MRIFIILAFGLFLTGVFQGQFGLPTEAQAQVGSSISSDGSLPNDNAILDVQSPSTGDGKGMLIPRITLAQRTTASASLAGGLLNDSGSLRGGAAQGLIIYQTNDIQGLYFNTSQSATPAWVYLGASTTNYLPLTGGTMSGDLNMGAQVVSNVAHIDFNGADVSVGRGANGFSGGAAIGQYAVGNDNGATLGRSANGSDVGAAVGREANGSAFGAAVGYLANGSVTGVAVGASANGFDNGAAVGNLANGNNYGAAVGTLATGTTYGAAMGRQANGSTYGAAVGREANGSSFGAAMGLQANGYFYGAAVGYSANGYDNGAAMGYLAKGSVYGAAVGYSANGTNFGAAVGYASYGYNIGAAMGYNADGYNYGAAVGSSAKGDNNGAALGYQANGARTNVAIGAFANAQGGTNHIAIGYNVTNNLGNDTAVIRGHVYMDGGTGLFWRATFGEGSWAAKAFEIDHPLDPENKVLRHFCLEGPQVWNVYAGNVQLVNGQAVVELPDYYSALNLVGSEIYGLTPVGGAFPVGVGQKVQGNRFVIVAKEDGEVSWTIKVLRNDPGCREDLRRRPVEQRKNEIR